MVRARSRSPYRESRGAKRPRDDDHHNDRPREDTRRFKVRYEDRPNDGRPSHKPYDVDRASGPETRPSYNDRYDRYRHQRPRTRSRSPYSKSSKPNHNRGGGKDRASRKYGYGGHDQSRRGNEENHKRFPREQSVNDRGHSPVATASGKPNAETRHDQKHDSGKPDSTEDVSAAKYGPLYLEI